MKKGVIAALLILVLVVIVSPGIVGKLAEQSVDDSLNSAAGNSVELAVTAEGFDRGWFSSQGQHRIELGNGGLSAMLPAGDLPALLISTHLDHGLIPVTSMGRDKGSLAPGLGSAISTMAVELGDGETIALPGAVYSKIGLTGSLDSSYVVDAGTHSGDHGSITWEPATIDVATTSSSGKLVFSGDIGAVEFADNAETVSIGGVTFSGQQTPTEYGFSVGSMTGGIESLTVATGAGPDVSMKGLTGSATTSVSDGRMDATTAISLASQTIPGFGDISVTVDVSMDADAQAVGNVSRKIDAMPGSPDPEQMMLTVAEDVKDLFTAGLELRFAQFDVTLPMGTVESILDLQIPKSDRATFAWPTLLLATVASLEVKVSEAIVDFATQMNPQLAMVVGMGYLKKNGDIYEMNADLKQGLLTVNGAPIPLPLGALQ